MFTYVGLFKVAPIAREHLEKTPKYFDKIYKIVEGGGWDRRAVPRSDGPVGVPRHLRVSRAGFIPSVAMYRLRYLSPSPRKPA